MAYLINSSNKTQFMVRNGIETSVSVSSVLVESYDDLATLPDSISVGSLAYTAGFGEVYQKDFDGSWVEVVLK